MQPSIQRELDRLQAQITALQAETKVLRALLARTVSLDDRGAASVIRIANEPEWRAYDLSIRAIVGDPNGRIVKMTAGDMAIDLDNFNIWFANGLIGSTTWISLVPP